jgi:hypothetical protein
MKKRNTSFLVVILALASLLLMQACSKDNMSGGETPAGQGFIKVALTDLPGPYPEVNVDIRQVRVHLEGNAGNDGWIDLPTHVGVYNLLDLQNGIDSTIVDSTIIQAGKITQVRLVLGPNSTVMTSDSVLHDLKVPSGEQSGIKLVGELNIPVNHTLHVLLDFDANASIVEKGNGDFSLKPVIKVVQ